MSSTHRRGNAPRNARPSHGREGNGQSSGGRSPSGSRPSRGPRPGEEDDGVESSRTGASQSSQARSAQGQSSQAPSATSAESEKAVSGPQKGPRRGEMRGSTDGQARRERGDGLRTCLGCGKRLEPDELLQLVMDPVLGMVVDLRRKNGGRGAHVCPSASCVELAYKKQRVTRALHSSVELGPGEVLTVARQQLLSRINYFLSMAQKAGKIASGADQVVALLKQRQAACLVVADDVSEASLERLVLEARNASVPIFRLNLSREAFGQLLGKGDRAAGAIRMGPLAAGLMADLRLMTQLEPRKSPEKEPRKKQIKSSVDASGADPCRELPSKHGKE